MGDSLGVLQLTLRSGGYDWEFVPVAGASFTDSGSGECHAPPPARAFGVEADAMVDSSSPTTNYGTTTSLRVDSSPEREAYLRFNVSGLPGEARAPDCASTSGTRRKRPRTARRSTWPATGGPRAT